MLGFLGVLRKVIGHLWATIAFEDRIGNVRRHNDLSSYLPEHPSEPEVIKVWCGREASEAYRTKMKNRAHSARADRQLAEYRIATLQDR